MLLKQSTARNVMVFMVDATDHIAGKASLTLTITASKDGAAFASITPTVTDRGSGWYALALTTAHADTLGDFALHLTGTGADPTDVVYQVVVDLPGAAVTVSDKTGFRLSATGVDDVWDELTAGHTTAGTTGKALLDAGSIGTPPTVAQIADGLMQRASTNWEAAAPPKSLGAAVMKLTHKVETVAGALTTYRSNSSTVHMTQTEHLDASADPLIGLDGAT